MRKEKDSMGNMQVPDDAYYGAQTQRAIQNFQISDRKIPKSIIRAIGIIKRSCAVVNSDLNNLDVKIKDAIIKAADQVIIGEFDNQFLVDVYQTGSGTSTNMNANEIIANRASEILGGNIGDRFPVHPNDHVNLGQSSNDVIPTAIHIAACEEISKNLLPSLVGLHNSLLQKVDKFSEVVKIGRTHLQDATPILLGQEFSGYAEQINNAMKRIKHSQESMFELAIGGTAVGTGINAHKQFGENVSNEISLFCDLPFIEAVNHFEAQATQDKSVDLSSSLKILAVSLTKIANDIRLLSSGPRAGIGEIIIPAVQPGSSIMPGKVNPVISESTIQVCAQVIGNDTAITQGGLGSYFELNLMLPLIGSNLLESITILSNCIIMFKEKLIDGLEANLEVCHGYVESSLAMCTSLVPVIGYDRAAELAYKAHNSGKTIREVAIEENILSIEQLDKLLDPISMTKPGK